MNSFISLFEIVQAGDADLSLEAERLRQHMESNGFKVDDFDLQHREWANYVMSASKESKDSTHKMWSQYIVISQVVALRRSFVSAESPYQNVNDIIDAPANDGQASVPRLVQCATLHPNREMRWAAVAALLALSTSAVLNDQTEAAKFIAKEVATCCVAPAGTSEKGPLWELFPKYLDEEDELNSQASNPLNQPLAPEPDRVRQGALRLLWTNLVGSSLVAAIAFFALGGTKLGFALFFGFGAIAFEAGLAIHYNSKQTT